MITLWLEGLVRRRGGRLAGTAVGVGVAVALLGCLGVFLSASKATMTARAATKVGVDWQVQVAPGADPAAVAAAATAEPGSVAALPVGFAHLPGLSSDTDGAHHTTGAATVLGLPDGYRTRFPTQLRTLAGADNGVLIAQQTAANLHASPGTPVTITRPGLPPATVTVAGIVDLPQANSLFQTVGAPSGSQPVAPPDNVLLLPAATYRDVLNPMAAAHPDLLTTQIHLARSHDLPTDPATAYTSETGAAHHLDAVLAGAGQVGDNLGAVLGAARQDAAYATVLFLFLGAPGAALAAVLTTAIAGTGAARRRREQALMRTRGATTATVLTLATVEAVTVGVVGGVIGLTGAALIGSFGFASASFGATPATSIAWAAAAFAAGLAIAAVTLAWPTWRDLRGATVRAARVRAINRAARYARPVAILVLLAASLAVFRSTRDTTYALVLAPEGVPTISVDYWAFTAPALLWVAAALSIHWLTDTLLSHGRQPLARLLRPVAGTLAGTVAASLTRQRRLVAQAVTILALAVAFAASTATFNATYRTQAGVDARLTNGADVTVTTSDAGQSAAVLTGAPGVRHVEPMQHRYAYIGADLQDLYGVNPATVTTTGLQDSWFAGGTATALMQQLAAQPDGILVSAETVKDFQLQPGDAITLRLTESRTGQPGTAVFHYLGVVKEFPTAPSDSFFVANASYIGQVTNNAAAQTYLVDTGGAHPGAVAAHLRSQLGASATVTDITTAAATISSSLTSVDLTGLTRIELALALGLAVAGGGLMLALTLAERRRTFALAAILGATRRQLAGFVAAEAATIAAAGLILGALTGWALSHMITGVLTGVFDPPPDHLTVPWPYLAGVAALALAAITAAAVTTVRASDPGGTTHMRHE